MNRHGRVLVVEDHGHRIRAAITQRTPSRTSDRVTIGPVIVASGRLNEALQQILIKLRKIDSRLPSRAVMLSNEVIPDLLRLPIPPGRPRTREQMNQLIQWELHPIAAQRLAARRIGILLTAAGHLTGDQVRQILAEQRACRASDRPVSSSATHTAKPPSRFGQIAIEKDWIDQQALDECLAAQDIASDQNADMKCGWVALQGHNVSCEAGQHPWLVCGADRRRCQAWATAFQESGIELQRVYPILTSSTAALNGELDHADAAVMDVRSDSISCAFFKDGCLTDLGVTYPNEPVIDSQPCQAMLSQMRANRVWVSASGVNPDDLCSQLTRNVPGRVDPIPLPPVDLANGDHDATDLAPMVGAARHAMGCAKDQLGVWIDTKPQRQPLYTSRKFVATTLAVILIALVSLSEYWLFFARGHLEQTRVTLNRDLRKIESTTAQINGRLTQANGAEARLTKYQAQQREIAQRIHLLDQALPDRETFYPRLLDSLAEASFESIVIDRVRIQANQQITITGWARGQDSAHVFVHRLSRQIGAMNLTIVQSRLIVRSGRFGPDSRAFEIRLRRT